MENKISVSEVADITKMSKPTIRWLIKNNKLNGGIFIPHEKKNMFYINRYVFYKDFLGWNEEMIDTYHTSRNYQKYCKGGIKNEND